MTPAELAAAAARGGATLFQLRDKRTETRPVVATARAVLAALAPFARPLLINDRVDVALAVGAAGVHLGQDDLAPADARRLLGPSAIVGATVHHAAEADMLDAATVDYAGIGPVFGTGSKADAEPPIGPGGLADLIARIRQNRPGFPCCGIAGVDHANAAAVIAAGADGVAVIADIFMADDVEAATRRLRRNVDHALGERARHMTPIALTIAGSDSGGGAGIQADLKTFSALGVYGCSVITALTAQNTLGVQGIHGVDPAFVRQQMDSVLGDLAVAAVKIGMLGTPETIAAVADGLAAWRPRWVVLDPVMVAKGGDRLLQDEAVAALRERLLPLASLITPNLPEAAALLGEPPATSRDAMAAVAARLRALGPAAVLLKGGHLGGADSPDLLLHGRAQLWLEAPRLAIRHTHGTGCTLASAITALLARGRPLPQAVAEAKTWLTAAIAAADGLGIGHGIGPVHHFHALWPHLETPP